MQWGDFVAELWLYVPLIGFWLAAIALFAIGFMISLRARNQPGGIDYEFSSSEPEGVRPEFASSEEDQAHSVHPTRGTRPIRAPDEALPLRPPKDED